MNLQELLKLNNLDFEVHARSMYVLGNPLSDPASLVVSNLKQVPDAKAVMRNDTNEPICAVGGAYEPKGYASILEPFNILIGGAQIVPIAAYSERNGAVARIRFNVPGTTIIVGELELKQEFLVTSSHDGRHYWTITIHGIDPQRRVYPVGEVGTRKIKHTKSIHDRVSGLADLFSLLMTEWDTFAAKAQSSLNVQITETDAKTLIAKTFPSVDEEKKAKIAKDVIARWKSSVFPTHRASVFGLYIACCNRAQDNRRVRNTIQRQRANDNLQDIKTFSGMIDKKLFSMWAQVSELVD